jgi:hypothetical protein
LQESLLPTLCISARTEGPDPRALSSIVRGDHTALLLLLGEVGCQRASSRKK